MNTLIKQVQDWGIDKGLMNTSPVAQSYKIIEEFGETTGAMVKGKLDELKDGIGDTLVTIIVNEMQLGIDFKVEYLPFNIPFVSAFKSLAEMVNIASKSEEGLNDKEKYSYQVHANYMVTFLDELAKKHNWTLEECLQVAYDEIKDRKGKTTKEGFIKEEE